MKLLTIATLMLAAALATGGCAKKEEGPKTPATMSDADKAAKDAANKAGDAAEDAGKAIKDAAGN